MTFDCRDEKVMASGATLLHLNVQIILSCNAEYKIIVTQFPLIHTSSFTLFHFPCTVANLLGENCGPLS